MGGPPVYQNELFELSMDSSYNSLDNTCRSFISYLWKPGRVTCSTNRKQRMLTQAVSELLESKEYQLESSK
jgi:hypothetical protein